MRGRVRAALAATTGVEGSADVVSYLLAGADVVMSASALLRYGPEHAGVLLDGLRGRRPPFAPVGDGEGERAAVGS
jgi:dihydroorotate dehydrogenase (fumarate)